MVAEDGDTVQGFMVYTLHERRLTLHRLAVRPEYKRQGVATALLRKLCSKLSSHRRTAVTIEVDGDNLPGCCLLRKAGFRCVRLTQRDGADVYSFRFLNLSPIALQEVES